MDYTQYPPPNGYDPYSGMQPQPPKSGLAIASLVLGIISVVLSCLCVNLITAPLAIIFGIIAITKKQGGIGLAIAGIITAAASIFLSFLLYLLLPFMVGYIARHNHYDPEGAYTAAMLIRFAALQIREVCGR